MTAVEREREEVLCSEPERVEAGARALYEFERGRAPDEPPEWPRIHEDMKEAYRKGARVVLTAALAGGEGDAEADPRARPHLLPGERTAEGDPCSPAAGLIAALLRETGDAEREGVTRERIAEILHDLAKDIEEGL